jgi:hypothetical protein
VELDIYTFNIQIEMYYYRLYHVLLEVIQLRGMVITMIAGMMHLMQYGGWLASMIHVIHVLGGHLIGSDLLIRCYLPHLIKHLHKSLPQWQRMIRLTFSADLSRPAHARTHPQRPLYRSTVTSPFFGLIERRYPSALI